MGKINFRETTYSDGQGRDFPAILITWAEVERYLGEPHTGDADQDQMLVQGLIEAGAPGWVENAPGWTDERGPGFYDYLNPA